MRASWPDIQTEARRLSRLAFPVIIGNLGFVLLGVTDTFFAGEVSEQVLAAVALGNIISFSMLMFGQGVLRGLDPFFTQAHGARDTPALTRALWRALLIAAALSIPLITGHVFSDVIMTWLRQPAETIPIAAQYCMALIPGILPALLFTALALFLQGMEKMHLPMLAMGAANVMNIALDAVLILGWEAAGIPAMGATGCGMATAMVQWGTLLVLLLAAWPTLRAHPLLSWRQTFTAPALARMLSTGLPVGVQASLEGGAFAFLGLMMGMLGTTQLAAHGIAINLIIIGFMIPFGLAAAASTRVGNLVGAGKPWHLTAWIAIAFSVVWMACSASTLLLTSSWIGRIFIDNSEVVAIVAILMPVAAAFQVFDGIQAATFGVLRGAGDTRFPALVNMIGYWVIGIPIGYIWGVELTQDPRRVWAGLAIGLLIVAVLVVWRLVWVMRRGAKVVSRE